MQVFEIKTNKSDYPFIVIAEGLKKAVELLSCINIYDSNIIRIEQLDKFKSGHILIEAKETAKKEIEREVRSEMAERMPHWRKEPSGVAGGGNHDRYLIRSSKGNYFTSPCLGGENYYIELESLEQLPGLTNGD